MSENGKKQGRDFSLYDRMSSEELEAVLRTDFDATDAESDLERTEYILNELLRRDQETAPESLPDVEESWERFRAAHFGEGAAAVSRRPRKKLVRTLLLAAAIACFMSITAFAALYNMRFNKGPEEPTLYRIWDDTDDAGNTVQQWTTNKPAMVFNFSTTAESAVYYLQANWLPSEPEHAFNMYTDFWSDAVSQLIHEGIPYEQQTEEMRLALINEMLREHGLTEEEAKSWYYRYDAETMEDVAYQVLISSPASLYNMEFTLGTTGSTATVVKEELHGDVRELRIAVDSTETAWAQIAPDEPLIHCNYIFLYNEAEGWLVRVQGTLDMDTLEKIADSIEVYKSDMTMEYKDNGQRMGILDVGRG